MNKDKISDEELEILVSAYQDGSSDAAEKLVHHYNGYFQKFLNVLKYRFHINDHTERGFARWFIKSDEARENTHLFRKSDYIRRVLFGTVAEVKERYDLYEADELKSEMVILFLEMASKHNFEAPFRIYVSSYFPRKLYKVIRKLGAEKEGLLEVYYNEDDIRVAHMDEYHFEDRPKYFIHPTTPTDFDENWVNGYGCGEIFQELTIYERRILKWYYEWRTLPKQNLDNDIALERKAFMKKNEEDIAELLGCSRKTVNIKRNEIKRKLEELAKELHLIRDNQSLSHI